MPPRRPSAATVVRAASMLRAAGDPGRLALLLELQRGPAHVGALAATLGETLSTVSQRLRVLRTDGLVRGERDGKHVVYQVADAHVADLLHAVVAHAGHRRGTAA